MGIESTMTALTEALNNHTKALEGFVKASGKAGAAAGGTKTESAGTKPADKPAGTKPGTKTKKITQEMVQTKFGDFLKVGDKAERATRLETVKKINAHFGVPKMTEADPSIWPDAFAVLDRVIADEDIDDILAELDGGEGEGEDDGDDGDSVV